ncbi:hypothetical protein [Youngiibacter multivorans]|uniref:GNAT family N-acetyltransferase n=1 Tax=Youngiibacter multivorans TaxID=937251 RepID=A0ABS4G802_9CLOT|nr:hypothetical protein [Youngiibacter multivorans]MBP1920695.1 hypothetical protein [Youngiibacter multivorans]
MSDEAKAQELISIFVCSKDIDIENFIKQKAIMFEKLGKSRTFLVFDEDSDKFNILGYYTIAIQVLKIPSEFSNRRILKLDGLSAKRNGEIITELPAILIGQIGKNELYKDNVTGHKIMEFCLNTIFDGQARLGGRLIILECKKVPYFYGFYEQFGFNKLEKEYQDDEFVQFFRIFEENELVKN